MIRRFLFQKFLDRYRGGNSNVEVVCCILVSHRIAWRDCTSRHYRKRPVRQHGNLQNSTATAQCVWITAGSYGLGVEL